MSTKTEEKPAFDAVYATNAAREAVYVMCETIAAHADGGKSSATGVLKFFIDAHASGLLAEGLIAAMPKAAPVERTPTAADFIHPYNPL